MFYLRYCETMDGDGICRADRGSGSRTKTGRCNSQMSEMLMDEDGCDLDMKHLWDSVFT